MLTSITPSPVRCGYLPDNTGFAGTTHIVSLLHSRVSIVLLVSCWAKRRISDGTQRHVANRREMDASALKSQCNFY